jgi:hypothetical protein
MFVSTVVDQMAKFAAEYVRETRAALRPTKESAPLETLELVLVEWKVVCASSSLLQVVLLEGKVEGEVGRANIFRYGRTSFDPFDLAGAESSASSL